MSLDRPALDRRGVRVVFGSGALSELDGLLTGARVLVVTTSGRSKLAAAIEGRVFTRARPHVPRATVDTALVELGDADTVVTIGGGTAIGLGKAIALERDVRLVCVPTTYSGSEMTNIWGVTGPGGKVTGRDERVRPSLVVYDPALTTDLPPEVSVASGLNAMAHAVEALWANDVSDAVFESADQSVRGWAGVLSGLTTSPYDIETRAKALRAAHFAGVALDGATMGLQHQLAHVLGGGWSLPHAPTHAALLPHVIAYNVAHAPRALKALQKTFGLDPAGALFERMQEIGAPTRLERAVPVSEVVERVLAKPYPNPAPLDPQRLERLLHDVISGTPPRSHSVEREP